MKHLFAALIIAASFAVSCRSNNHENTDNSANTSREQEAEKQQVKKNQEDASKLAKHREDSLKAIAAAQQKPEGLTYHFEYKKIWKTKDSFDGYKHQALLAALNRVDITHLKYLDSFIVPDRYTDSLADYLPFPKVMPSLANVNKILIFSYSTQTFAAYENGNLVLTGPTNMGKKSTPTPTGLFFCNWKSKEAHSTVDKSWILKWNFNVSNFGGVGFHQYTMPGYPVSHSCMRLWASQAETLYNWAEQWKLKGSELLAKGTPVIIYGEYPFGKTRPWFKLVTDSKLLDISVEELDTIIAPHLDEIMQAQENRVHVMNGEAATDTTKVDTTKRVAGA
jgi:hypothetical protein